jgi:purine-nucleoside phosphorylase
MFEGRLKSLEKAACALRKRLPQAPKIALVLGSGLSEAFKSLGEGVTIPWREVPALPQPTVSGHVGEFFMGTIQRKPILVQYGRIHAYEGYSLAEVTFSIRLFALLGVEVLIVTNASGAINPGLSAGDLVLITDHINMMAGNPLCGPNLERFGPRFPDMSMAYSPRLRTLAKKAAAEEGIVLKEGVYLATHGPSYETPAEIRAFRTLGADLVGMSTVPEVIAAVHAGMEVLGISCATNLAAGVVPEARLTHQEVIETTRRKGAEIKRLVEAVIGRL